MNSFGTIEKLPSGRFRVRWYDPDGRRHSAPQTFLKRNDARLFLATLETDRLRQTYKAPRRSKETVGDYGREWIRTRAGLKQSTRYGYELDFRLYVVPYLGDRLVDQLQPAQVREWHATLSEELFARLSRTGRDGKATVARSYRLLRSILQTAVDDDLLTRNPCRLPGAGITRSTERPVLSAAEIATFAAEVPGPYRAFVVLAGFSGLRAGELAALRVSDLNLEPGAATVRVSRRFYRVNGTMTVDTPKSERGFRTVAIPDFVASHLVSHLTHFRPDVAPDALVFVTSGGRDVLDSYSQVTRRALHRMGRPDVRAHDLRHSAMTAAAEHGATLATLMQMAGHSTPDAALRYQHATMEHSRRVANALDASASGILGTG